MKQLPRRSVSDSRIVARDDSGRVYDGEIVSHVPEENPHISREDKDHFYDTVRYGCTWSALSKTWAWANNVHVNAPALNTARVILPDIIECAVYGQAMKEKK